MNRFRWLELEPMELEFEFVEVDYKGPRYRHKEKCHEIYTDRFDIHVTLELYHWPEADKKQNDFMISNIKIHTDDTELKISDEEYETLARKIKNSIKICGLFY